ncbi:MAG TPA: NrfD/PsrC family molybdoenzyme membrane anchor subunit [Candidatus Angelobacter sp.]|nr:NrfD/PsrC family molybdoenzyme membrane anchor subunit [Candidatus Angelobacter sp.]
MRYGFVIDQDRCIGCHACTVACKEEHQVPVGVFRTWVKYIEKGEFPNTSRHFGVMRCNHCDSAPCTTICPTNALFRRSDGIIDFDNQRCIGCKSCMQACPYDALHIDPQNNTAAKCNFCAHRVEVKLEPACVIVCPTQAIIAGDLDSPESKVSRIVATQKVSVRKPHKGTQPKLYYVGIEGDLLEPARLTRQSAMLWADRAAEPAASAAISSGHSISNPQKSKAPNSAREVYDVAHPAPWGWKIALYLWVKSIAAGVLMVAAILLGLNAGTSGELLNTVGPIIALAALGGTMALLVFDLKRPDRFYYLLLKPNFRSWLVLGAYILMGYGALCLDWLYQGLFADGPSPALRWATAALGAAAACYSAFLFAQAKGRDLWQSPLFLWHLLAQAFVAGSATLLGVSIYMVASPAIIRPTLAILLASLAVSLLMILGEVALPHANEDVRLATRLLVRGKQSGRFWGMVVFAGSLLPIALCTAMLSSGVREGWSWAAAVLALAGLWWFEDLWVKAGQAAPLS